jgi:hypothetical protein
MTVSIERHPESTSTFPTAFLEVRGSGERIFYYIPVLLVLPERKSWFQ